MDKNFVFSLSKKDVNQLSVCITLYMSEMFKVGFTASQMPNVVALQKMFIDAIYGSSENSSSASEPK